MCPPSKTSDQLAEVKITGSIGSVGGDIVGRDKITYGLDEEGVVAAFLRAFQKMEHGNGVLISRRSPLPNRTTLLAPRGSSGIKPDLISQLRGALDQIVDLISDLDNDRDIDSANSRLSEWKKETDKIVNGSFEKGNLHYEVRLYGIMPDANQRTPFNKIKNESRKCQKVIMDILREIEGD